MSGLRSVEEHVAALLFGLAPLPAVSRATPHALGLVLAEAAVARLDLPGFDNSAMDGYAVRAAECAAAAGADASESGGFRLPVCADIAAGDTRRHVLAPGSAARIMTGAPMPEGADAVVPVEDSDGGVDEVTLRRVPEVGRHVRPRGEDVRSGQQLLEAGLLLTPGRIALLAAGNVDHVLVHPRPRVTVLSTGDELIPLGDQPTHGQIIDSNQLMLAALVDAAGGALAHSGRLPDEPGAVRAAFLDPPGEPDLVLTSGGVSMGAHDTVKEVLREAGGVDFVKVAMRPGMPQGGGRIGRDRTIPIVTLPGNPVSSFVSFHVFVLPVLRRLAGREGDPAGGLNLEEAVAGASWRGVEGRVEFTWVHVRDGIAHPERGQGSHMVGALAAANALAVLPAPTFAVTEGDRLRIIPFVGEA